MTSQLEVEFRKTSWRLALQTGTFLLLMLAAIAGSVLLIVSAGQNESSLQLLRTATDNVDSVQDAPSGVWLAISDQGRLTVSPGMPDGLPDIAVMSSVASGGEPIDSDVVIGEHSYTVHTAESKGRVVQAVLDRHESQEQFNRLMLALVMTCGGAVVVSSLIAVWLARRAMRPMADALELQRRFVMDASHELRTPLTLLSTRAQLLKRRLDTSSASQDQAAEVGSDVEAIIEDAGSLNTILEDLLIAADSRQLDRVPVDLVAVADDVVRSFGLSATRAGVTLTRTGIDGELEISASPTSLRRALVALVDNAIQFAQSRVEVALSDDVLGVNVTVSDDGPGFTKEMKTRAFERFATTRVREPRDGGNRTASHYGLGLALVADVAAQHGGSAVIESQPGSGAVIMLRLPRPRPPRH
ncbi:MAG: HAMP domain-containing sensor histidine kinase [Lacisediminihabitans sp.]